MLDVSLLPNLTCLLYFPSFWGFPIVFSVVFFSKKNFHLCDALKTNLRSRRSHVFPSRKISSKACASHDGWEETKPMEKFTEWKFFIFASWQLWSFRAKTSAQSTRLPTTRGWFPCHSIAGWKLWKFLTKIVSIQALFSLCNFHRLWLQFSNRPQPNVSHAFKFLMKWLKCVYIIPTTFSSNDEVWRESTRGGVKWHRKCSGWLCASLIRTFISISPWKKLVFSPLSALLRLHKPFCVPLMCSLWK